MISGHTALHFPVIDSTNREARRRIEQGGAGPCVIYADRQSAGVGRRGRAWESPLGNISCTVMQPLVGGLSTVGHHSFIYSTAIAHAANRFLPHKDARVKWPNDVMVGGKKLAGILLETATAPDNTTWLIAGFGVNVATVPVATTGALYLPTAMQVEGAMVDASALMAEVLTGVEKLQGTYARDGFGPIRTAWLALAMGLGEPITVNLPDSSQLQGIFDSLDDNGTLLLDIDGQKRHINAGDVFIAPHAG